jgi:hypothetical protein
MMTPQQSASILARMFGYSGPADQRSVDQFLASNPAAAARMGKYQETMNKMVGGKPIRGFQVGGTVNTTSQQVLASEQQAIRGLDQFRPQVGSLDPLTPEQLAGLSPNERNLFLANQANNTFDSQLSALQQADNNPLAATQVSQQVADPEFFNSPEYQDFQNTKPMFGTADMYDSPFFGQMSSSSTGRLQDQAYINYLKRTNPNSPLLPQEGPQLSLPTNTSMFSGMGQFQQPGTNPPLSPTLEDLQQGQQRLAAQASQPLQAAVVNPMQVAPGLIASGVGQVGETAPITAETVSQVGQVTAPTPTPASLVEAVTAAPDVKKAVSGLEAAKGEVSEVIEAQKFDPQKLAQLGLTAPQINEARKIADIPDLVLTDDQLVKAATLASTGLSLPQAIAQTTGRDFTAVAAEFEGKTPEAIAQDAYNLTPTQAATVQRTEVEDAAKAAEIPTAEAAQSQFQSDIQSVQGKVGANDLVKATDILAAEKAVSAVAATVESLSEAATMNAAQGTLSQASLAKAAQGMVTAESTIQGQMSQLMQQFNDGTPAWAAGAMRAANAAMAARGLGGSSIAGAAIVQAAMEAATPIAAQDAQVFAQMNLTNLNNRQQAALSNAAASQNMDMRNLDFRQQAALQNSTNAFALQGQNLSNTQQVVLANAQFKAALQNQTLDIKTQTALTNAARYAEMNNLNLNREQQTRLQNSAQNLQVDMANLSSSQQTALANLQVRAALRGQELSNDQQMAMLSSTQAFEAANLDATNQQQAFMQDAAAQAALEGRALDARQQTALFNVSAQLREREIELTNEQQTRLFNTTNALNIEVQNLSNRQQTALANAQIEAAIRGQELSNSQQTNVVNAARIGEIANINFTAEQQRAVENARLAQTVDIENLNAAQAKVLSDAAAMSSVDMTNLNFRQQAEVQNAQNFLQLDLANLTNEQQTELFKTQQIVQGLFSDQAAQNAAAQFNAASENQTEQFFQSLVTQVSQFNTSQVNAMNQFNAGQTNATAQFNAELDTRRDLFNAQNALIIEQANAQWRQNVTTLNTAAQNEANMDFAKTLNALSSATLANIWQRERDNMSFAFTAEQSGLNRQLSILLGDKQLDEIRAQLKDKDETFKMAFFTDLLFGGSSNDNRSGNVFDLLGRD